MDKKQAYDLIEQLFTTSFDRERYELFLKNLLNRIEPGSRAGKHYVGNLIKEAYKPLVNQYWCLGKYIDPDGAELDLLVVEIKSFAKLERARSALRNFAVSCLKQFEKDQSLIAFYAKDDNGADWRFSFVKRDYRTKKDDGGKIRLREDLSPVRRYSYLVGEHEKSHTACKQLLPVLLMDYANPHIEDIEKAFSVEAVTEEFFEQYKTLFQKLAGHLKTQSWFQRSDDTETDAVVSRFAKKLLGQIVFLYFLQKKGWLGAPEDGKWGDGSKRFLRESFDDAEHSGVSYYSDFLCFLFYEALACERKDQEDPGYYDRFDCRVPFLNGGLFEADYDWRNEPVDIPDSFFHNDEKTKAGDIGTGILDVFDRYNFTIREDEPLDKEVAVDPEMLGKVFENMLEVTERKKAGAFYTPREIVHYMCQESLILYLDNRLNSMAVGYEDIGAPQIDMLGNDARKGQLNLTIEHQGVSVPKGDIEILIREGHLFVQNDEVALSALQRIEQGDQVTTKHKVELPEPVRIHSKAIDAALADIKVCDPAIGSGAFPVGMLHEIVTARQALAHHTGNTSSSYTLKRHAIAESIYGVDIDASAIDIARLRLWLSLIVDEEDYDTIEPLPNLDYKIIRGDSLIGIDIDLFNQGLLDEIETKKREFFDTTDHDRKIELGSRIDALIHEITKGKEVFDFKVYFSEVWHLKNGFDIVIGNPPYVQIQKFSGKSVQKNWERQNYETFAKTGDIYCLFYEKGYRLLRQEGVLAFITSNKWMRAAYGEKLRRFFSQKTQPQVLIDFSSFQVFDSATVDTNVLLFTKENRCKPVRACLINSSFNRNKALDVFVSKNSIELTDFSEESWVISDKANYEIKKKIEAAGKPLKNWDINIYRGILTGFNEAFIIDGKKKAELIAEDPKSAEIIKPVLRGRDIKRYRVDFVDLWVIITKYGSYKTLPEKYPAVYRHLSLYENKLKERGQCRYTSAGKQNLGKDYPGQHHWLELDNNPKDEYLLEFEKEKITWGNLALSSQFALADAGLYINAPSPLIGGGSRYLLAVLNSAVADYYIRSLGVTRNGGYFEYKPMFVEQLPVPQIDDEVKKPFEILAEYVLLTTTREKKIQSAFFEQLIDGLIYELYFPEELKGAGKELQPHIGNLTPLAEEMTEEQKLAIVQREFDRLSDPAHPIRQRLDTLDEVEVVRTVRAALKR
jgi:hypothetical protein